MSKIFIQSLVILFLLSLSIYSQRESWGYVGDREIFVGVWNGDTIYYANSLSCLLNDGYSLKDVNDFINRYDASIRFNYFDNARWGSIDLTVYYDALELIDEWQNAELFYSVEPVRLVTASSGSSSVNDPKFLDGTQWYFHNYGQNPPGGTIDADIDMPDAWEITRGSPEILISVIDSGIPLDENTLELSHADLNNNNRILLEYSGLFLGIPNFVRDGWGHGTHVTGIIAAETNNSEGIAGVAGNCKIMVCRVFDDEGNGLDDAIIGAIWHSISYKEVGMRIINLSLSATQSQALENMIDLALAYDILVICAAGNHPGSNQYPARYSLDYDNVIAVSATDHNDIFSHYSNAGTHINLAAPGGYGPLYTCPDENDIYSTFPDYYYTLQSPSNCPDLELNYDYAWGTSMSAPIVSGITALILSVNPELSASEVRDILQSTADDKGTPGWDEYFGWGRVNAFEALRYTLENYGGTLTQDLTIPVGETWNFNVPGVQVTLENGASIIVEGTLNVQGSPSSKVTFKRSGSSGTWGSITFDGSAASSSVLNNVVVQNGAGIRCLNGANVTISNSEIDHCTEGIYFYNSQPSIINNQIIEPIQNGINGDASGMSVEILHNTITRSGSRNYQGIILGNYTNGYIAHNDISGFMWGSYIGGGTLAIFTDFLYQTFYPNNRFRNNSVGIAAGWGGYIFAGYGSWFGKNNSIYNNSVYDAKSYQYSDIYAQYNWWGNDGAQIFVDGTSTLDVSFPLSSDPWIPTNPPGGDDDMTLTLVNNNYQTDGGGFNPDSSILAGLYLERQGRIEEAIIHYKQMVRDTTYPGFAIGRLVGIKNRYRIQNIRAYLESLLVGNRPYKPIVLTVLAGLLIGEDKYRQAMFLYNKIIYDYPETYAAVNALFEKFFAALNYAKNQELAGQLLSELQSLGLTDEEFLMRLEIAENLYNGSGLEYLGKSNNTNLENIVFETPHEYLLEQNYPNPFNPNTQIKYSIKEVGLVSLKVYDVLGNQVANLVNEEKPAGDYTIIFNASNLSSGIYFYTMSANNFHQTKKMILLK